MSTWSSTTAAITAERLIPKPARRRRALWLALVPLLCACGAATDSSSRPRNILLVVIDTLRADHIGAQGYTLPTTPRMDALAERGATFQQAIAQSSWTRPSMAALMTGLYPTATGLTCSNFRHPEGACDLLHPGLVTVAELLSEGGFDTAGVVANINVDPVFGFDQGFEHYVCVPARLAQEDPDWRSHNDWLSKTTAGVTDEGLRWLASERGEQPFLLYLHYLDPHEPYEPPAEYTGAFQPESYPSVPPAHRDPIARYDAELRYVDVELGRILDRLDELGLADETAIVLTSDHGEEFGDHGGSYHGWTLYDEQTHVPLVVVADSLIPAHTRVPTQVRVMDVAPTLLEMVGQTPPGWMHGESLLPLIEPDDARAPLEAGEDHRPAFSERAYAPLLSYRAPPWKLIHNRQTGESWLFDLEADPGEHNDVAERRPFVVSRLLRSLLGEEARATRTAREFPAPEMSFELSESTIEQLRALGYQDP